MHLHYQLATSRCILLDYDGTLVPLVPKPEDAVPTPELKQLLNDLAADPKNNVVVISGRDQATLDRWLGDLPISMVAEHGATWRMKNEPWQQLVAGPDQWKSEIRPIMQKFVTRCVGSFVEEKTNTIAWHYRKTHPDLGFTRSRELINTLSELLQNTMLQVIDGNKVVEVRMSGFDKGVMALKMVNEIPNDFILCIGDDTTDEDMFKALSDRAYTIKVGNTATAAQYMVYNQKKVLELLEKLMVPLGRKKEEGVNVKMG